MPNNVVEVTLLETHQLTIPEEAARQFAEQGQQRIKVRATFQEKEIWFHAALRKNHGRFVIMFSKQKQKDLGLLPTDTFQLQLFEDDSKYGVDVPEEFEVVLSGDVAAYKVFETLTKGKQRSIIYAIKRFKDSQKRIDKSLLICENLKRGIRDHSALLRPH